MTCREVHKSYFGGTTDMVRASMDSLEMNPLGMVGLLMASRKHVARLCLRQIQHSPNDDGDGAQACSQLLDLLPVHERSATLEEVQVVNSNSLLSQRIILVFGRAKINTRRFT